MSTIKSPRTLLPYGITEKKKADLDQLTSEVLAAQFQVDQYQAIVSSLSDKLASFQGFLAEADATRTYTLNNRNLVEQLLQGMISLGSNSGLTLQGIELADKQTRVVAGRMTVVIQKLIYSAEVINKLADLILRKKALNPLISDEMVSRISRAGNDANNAVAQALLALKAAFAAQATNIESGSALVLEQKQASRFYQVFTGLPGTPDFLSQAPPDAKDKGSSLRDLVWAAYDRALVNYEGLQTACRKVSRQLNEAQAKLNTAQLQLNSLRRGLAAGTAAAYAA